jgi:hypothetical protein
MVYGDNNLNHASPAEAMKQELEHGISPSDIKGSANNTV